MDTATLVILVIFILALLFFGYTILKSNAGSSQTGRVSYPTPSYVGGGCGR